MKKSAYAVGLAACAAALTLAACSSSSSSGGHTSGGPSTAASSTGALSGAGKTLVVQTPDYYAPLFKQVGAQLEQELPGLKVSYQSITGDQESTTNLQFVEATPPDICDCPNNLPPYTGLLKAGLLLPLDDVWQKDNLEKGYGQQLADTLKAADGHPYVVSYNRTLYGVVWYNADVFSKLGIQVPADQQMGTMDELLKIVSACRAGGYQPLAVGGNSGYQLTWILDSLLPTSAPAAQLTNLITNYNANVPVTTNYTDPAFTKVLDRLKEMYDGKVFQDGTLGMDSPTTNAFFAAGKSCMLMGHNLTPTGTATLKGNFKLGFMFLPPINPGAKTLPVNYAGNTVAIPAKAKNPDIAKEFIRLLMDEENQVASIKLTQGGAPGIDVPAAALSSGAPATELALLSYGSQYGTASGWASIVPAKLNTADPYIEKLFTGALTSQQIGKDFDDIRDQLRAGK